MLYLNQLNYYVSVLVHTKEYACSGGGSRMSGQMGRLYNDALMGLFHLGIEPDEVEQGLAYQIDGDVFPIPASMRKIMAKEACKENEPHGSLPPEPAGPEQSRQAEKGPSDLPEGGEMDGTASEASAGMEMRSWDAPHEPQAIVNRHLAKVVNKKNPSDVEEFAITVLPLGVKDHATATDIVVEIEHNGIFTYFVSEQKRKSIMAEIDGIPFNIRGQWKDRRFTSALYLGSAMKATHNLKNKIKEIVPDEISKEGYEDDFVREVGDSTLYILPFARLNEPNGRCKVAVVQETEGERQVYCDNEKEILLMYLGGVNFRIYGKWTADKRFKTIVEQAE